ncbi:MAG TPA: phospho-sugar mutase [Candidatus Corynebacterium avicola]|uniref:Phospho-sugar mutase n=1 Tax=Candidatus Corynebacterium avicola TaxID=2838527 RepID=A0A9D1RMC9_9CORY|nr:phospho-sugar mutase [Candidatus Corynebacterium avicola]
MSNQLSFGTAGLRASVGPGEDQMNVSTVTRATGGVAAWLSERVDHEGPVSVAVGFDSRYGSHAMARAAAETFAGAGFDVTLISQPAPTPVLAWVVRHRGLDAGVQITASHNPRSDNGYKLYLAGGSQLVSPADREIEALISTQPVAAEVPRSTTVSLDQGAVEGYVSAITAPLASGEGQVLSARRDLNVVYTALHGVGGYALEEAFRKVGFHRPSTVVAQRWPDPEFPSVDFPNPEEPGATDLLVETAVKEDADLVIALDPDADRCMIGIPDPEAPQGYRMLRGDEAGPLLATRVVEEHDPASDSPAPVVATTVVSSSLLGRIAEAHGWDFKETATGFKNLARAADDAPGELTFAYEEAIGTCPFPSIVADKDGIATALVTATWAAELKAEGTSLLERLRSVDETYGVVRTAQVSVRLESPAAAADMVDDWSAQPPSEFAGAEVEKTSFGLRLRWTADGLEHRLIARPSGTEPKAKFYLQVAGAGANDGAGTDTVVVQDALSSLVAQVRSLTA